MPRLRAPLLLTLLALASARAQGPPAFAFDLVIRNGRVMDPESGLDRAGLWVGIRGATIAAISDTALAGDVDRPLVAGIRVTYEPHSRIGR